MFFRWKGSREGGNFMAEQIGKELVYREYMMREEMLYHAPYNPEMEFYNAVKTGDEKTVEKSLKVDFCTNIILRLRPPCLPDTVPPAEWNTSRHI